MIGGWFSKPEEWRSLGSFYFERPQLMRRIEEAVADRRHALVYGAPRQGKSALVARSLKNRKSVTLHASREFGFADICRNYFLAIGCSVISEQKSKRKIGGKAEIQFKGPLISAGAALDGGTEIEQTLRSFTADISNPNDVCYLLREVGEPPCLVVNRFELLGEKQRGLLLDFLRVSGENAVLPVILVASSLEYPLSSLERLEVDRYVSVIPVPLLTKDESFELVESAFFATKTKKIPGFADQVFLTFGGDLSLTLDACKSVCMVRDGSPSPSVGDDAMAGSLLTDIQERTRNYFVALLAGIHERDWTIRYSERVPKQTSPVRAVRARKVAAEPAEEQTVEQAVAMHPVLRGDEVFERLRLVVAAQRERTTGVFGPSAKAGTAVLEKSEEAARQILRQGARGEPVRFVAYALTQLLSDPSELGPVSYTPARETIVHELNVAVMIGDMLLSAEPTERLVVDAARIEAYFTQRGRVIVSRSRGGETPDSMVRRLAKRLRKLQRSLAVDPPIFPVNGDLSEIVLWDPRNSRLYGDVKPAIRDLYERWEADLDDE